jgi:ribose transport system substrate-binding protein
MKPTKKCTEAGIPVICVDNQISPEADFITTVQSNNLDNGFKVGEWVAKKMRGKQMKIALISGQKGALVSRERRLAMFDALLKNN